MNNNTRTKMDVDDFPIRKRRKVVCHRKYLPPLVIASRKAYHGAPEEIRQALDTLRHMPGFFEICLNHWNGKMIVTKRGNALHKDGIAFLATRPDVAEWVRALPGQSWMPQPEWPEFWPVYEEG